jgi:PASTA domain
MRVRLLAGILAALLSGLAAVGLAGTPASAAPDLPEVRGLTPTQAQQAVNRAFNPAPASATVAVTVTFTPALTALPAGTDRSTVVASRASWLNPTQYGKATPQVTIAVGTLVPDLTGDTLTRARAVLAQHGLLVAAEPDGVGPDWLVTGQELEPGTVVEFRAPLTVFFAAPATSPTAAPLRSGPSRTALLVGGAVAFVVLMAIGALATLIGRRIRGRRNPPPAAERVEVPVHPGPVIGPELVELPDPYPETTEIRLEPHDDPGAFHLEEGPR